jgi:hypothetical protein
VRDAGPVRLAFGPHQRVERPFERAVPEEAALAQREPPAPSVEHDHHPPHGDGEEHETGKSTMKTASSVGTRPSTDRA